MRCFILVSPVRLAFKTAMRTPLLLPLAAFGLAACEHPSPPLGVDLARSSNLDSGVRSTLREGHQYGTEMA